MSKSFTVAVVGCTGMVGQTMLRVLEQRQFPVKTLRPMASERSRGKTVKFRGQDIAIEVLNEANLSGIDVALFSAGGSTSREFAPKFAAAGALVVDNSSAWRMDPEVPLCIPEVNLNDARKHPKNIIAVPNCSTIQMLVALKPIHDHARIRRIVVSTYQAISGAGAKAVARLKDQQQKFAAGQKVADDARQQIAGNVLMHWSVDSESGYQEEELKMVKETQKILGDPNIRVSPTTVRVPVETGHSESVNIECERPVKAAEVREWLQKAPGLKLMDDFTNGIYPTPLDVAGTDDVLVGRIRDDVGNPGGVQMWIVGDNLLKGAALNAVQIAEALLISGDSK